ncbi:NUDIX domain-containing protein [Chromatiaceae bacterium AAb-1]|nr:NUDIX domain-containing protein [Chromatiaceae bacterium AAb-1]
MAVLPYVTLLFIAARQYRIMSREQLHLTVAAIVHYQQRFLFVEEQDKLTGQHVLNQPAGHMEAHEDLLSAARRELFEETGLQLAPVGWLGISQLLAANNHTYVRVNVIFEPVSLPADYQPQDPDIKALHWLNQTELQHHALPRRSALVEHATEQYLSGIRLPLNLILPPR